MPTIALALCCDDNYARHLGVALCSVLHNLSPNTQANIYIVHSKLNTPNKKKLEALLKNYSASINFIEVDPKSFDGLVISHHITPAAYIRIALPELLPQTVSTVLYLDCDIIAREDITPLATADIGACPVGAIPEGDQSSWCMNDLKHHAGIPHDAVYFNSGVLLINLEKWRCENLSKKLFQFIRATPHRIRLHDQDTLNIFFHATYKQLDYRWNFTVYHLMRPKTYSTEQMSIVHFITGIKPWHAGCDHPLKGEYFKYLAMTPWGATVPQKVPEEKKLQNKTALLANKICRKIFSVYTARQTIRARTLFRKEEIAGLSARFALKSILINTGIVKTSRETLLGYKVRFSSYETFVMLFNEIFIDNEYYFETTSTKPCIIDCCSNIGMAVLFFKRLYPYSRIIAFEPDAALFELLQENALANCLEDVQLRNSAVADQEGEVKLYCNDSSLLSASPPMLDGQRGARSNTRAPCVRLSSYIEGPVDFLKLGSDGNADAVIEELSQSGKLRLIKKMVLTYNHNMPDQAKGLAGILTTLEKYGFGYQLRAGYSGFCTDTATFQAVMIFAYNKNAC